MFDRRILLLLVLLVAGCAADATSPLLRNIRAVKADGTLSDALEFQDLTPFQQLLRDRLPPAPPQPSEIFALEVDAPGGAGTEGQYLALVRSGSDLVLRFYEQEDHRPRTDRFYYRQLTPAEAIEFDIFLKTHPLATLQHFGPVASAATAPAVEPAGDEVAASEPVPEPPSASAAEPTAEPTAVPENATALPAPDAIAGGLPILFRFTDARPDQSQTIVIQSPGPNDHPVIDLLQMLARFRDAGPFTARYSQTIPLTAHALFADPRRRVLYVWNKDDDLRIVVAASSANGTAAPGQAAESWLAYKEGRWEPSELPSELAPPPTQPASVPATEPATAPATEPAAETTANPYANLPVKLLPTPADFPDITADQIRELMGPRPPPRVETWWTEPNPHATVVMHYIPQRENNAGNGAVRSLKEGVTLGFVVPAFEFDDDHFAVDAARGTLYVVFDGQLFALPIPKAALKPAENPQ